ncbi:MAG TPA: hydantoinase/oxoprolinase N-terminal domain-containing protein [Pseudobdellovibrionaceae bacterium]
MAQAETDVKLILYVGESFVEAHLCRNQKSLHFNRWYLGKEGFKNGLQKFLQESGVKKISKAIVASRFVEKILTYRLGGSVATLTTKGFENWPCVRQPHQKVGPLSSMELMFSVDERCTAEGEITQEISDEEITELVRKLRQKLAKRICIHFLNARKNPHNQNKLKEVLLKENFEVFIPEFDRENNDEVSQWRKNILNASLSSTFEEVQEELNGGLKDFLPEGQRASFLSSEAILFDKESHYRLSSLWGAYGTWARTLKKQRSDKFNILYLGLEQFCLLNPENQAPTWNSPWGKIQAAQVQNQLLCLQPTTSIELSPWGELSFTKTVLGYEPGPMFMGRGQIPTLLDLWEEKTSNVKGIADRRSPAGVQKFKNQILALNKNSSQHLNSEEKVLSHLRQLALHKMAMDIACGAQS